MQSLTSPETHHSPNPHLHRNFEERARPLIRRGIPVIPLAPRGKNALIDDWPNRASTSPKQIDAWASRWPDANVGCVATYGYCYLDDDRGDLKERIERETGKKFPRTFTVETSTKGTGMRGMHYYFTRTERALEVGNCAAPQLFDFQCIDKQVVGPFSIHPSGAVYLPVDEKAPIAEIPNWLCEWIEQNTPKKAKPESDGNGPLASEDFDCGDWLDHYSDVFTTSLDGEWYVTSICPLTYTGEGTGHKHHGSVKTGFRFCNSTPEFHCFSTDADEKGAPHDQASFGDVVRHLNKYHAPYPGEIWEKRAVEELLNDWGLDAPNVSSRETTVSPERKQGSTEGEYTPVSSHFAAEPKSALAFPEQFMYGEAGILAKQMKVPLGLAYMALVGEFAIKCDADVMGGTRINTYTALVAPVGGGKNVGMDRGKTLLELRRKDEYLQASPAGTRALMTLIGDKPSGKRGAARERVPGPKKLLLITHEMTDVLKMTGVDNSTLASRLCDFWDDNEHVYPTGKDGVISVDCRLHWIGGVPASADNPTRFTELFDSETSHGLYDRLLIGYSDSKFNYRPWEPPTEGQVLDADDYTADIIPAPLVRAVSEGAQQVLDIWQPAGGGSRVKQNCAKVALITTMMNREEVVTQECMRCAIGIMEWQIELRKVFRPGEAVNDEAKCRVVILAAMDRAGAKHEYLNVKRLAHDRKWGDRFGDRIVKSTIANLEEMGEIVPKLVESKDGDKKKSKSEYMLRNWSSIGSRGGGNGENGESPSTKSR